MRIIGQQKQNKKMGKPTFENKQIVYLRTDPEQYPYQIVGVVLRPEEVFEYFVSDGIDEFLIRECQLSHEKILFLS